MAWTAWSGKQCGAGSLFVDSSGGASGGAWHAYDFSNNASVAAWANHIAATYAKVKPAQYVVGRMLCGQAL